MNNKILTYVLFILLFLNESLAHAYESKVDSTYAYLEEQKMYILLKSKPCGLTEKEMMALKTRLLTFRNNSKITRHKKIDSLEKLNAAYGYSVKINKLPTCNEDSLETSNQTLIEEKEFSIWDLFQ